MLMQTLLETYRDLTGHTAPDESVTTVSLTRPAANADRWVMSDSQQRRGRRQRRLARAVPRAKNGWSVRAW